MSGQIMLLDCPAYLDKEGTVRCGLPAEVRYRFLMESTEGPLESAMIRCPSGHFFEGPIENLTSGKKASHRAGPGRPPGQPRTWDSNSPAGIAVSSASNSDRCT
jgi:hypothetical protein